MAVIDFPKYSSVPITKDEVDNKITELRTYHVDESAEYLMEGLIEQIGLLGFPLQNVNNHSLLFLNETIRAVLFEMYNYEHPINHVVNNTIRNDETLGLVLDCSKIAELNKKKKAKTEN